MEVNLRFKIKVAIDAVYGAVQIVQYTTGETTYGMTVILPKFILSWDHFVREFEDAWTHELLHLILYEQARLTINENESAVKCLLK